MLTRSRITVLVVVLVLLGAAAVYLADRGNDDPARPGARPAQEQGTTVGQLADEYLKAVPDDQPIATVQGTVGKLGGGEVPGTLSVMSLQSNDDSTVLRWRLSAEGVQVNPQSLSGDRFGSKVSDAVVIESRQSDQLLRPGRFTQVGLSACTCGDTPVYLTARGVESSSVYTALAESATEVVLKVPGFPDLTVPVTRT